jgi:hypothetical protein
MLYVTVLAILLALILGVGVRKSVIGGFNYVNNLDY